MIVKPSKPLSLRATASLKNTSNAIWDILGDAWHPEYNPRGFVSLGLADNSVLHERLLRRMNTNFDISARSLALSDTIAGSVRLKTAVAHFLNQQLNPSKPLLSSQIITTNGVTSAIEHCSWALCDPNEGILVGRPYYRGFFKDVSLRPASKLVPVSFEDGDPLNISAVSRYEQAILRSGEQGCTIRAIMLCNPHNPLGRCYSRDFLIELMRLCQRFSIHLISDEIYALSVWREGRDISTTMEPFTSVLSIDTDGIIDPGLVHTLWGASKDFGSNGLRLGFIISPGNPDLLESIRGVGQYSSISGLTDSLMAGLLEDSEFLEGYIKENRKRLAELYSYVADFLDSHGISYAQGSNAAFFVWCDLLTPYLKIQNRSSATSDFEKRASVYELKEKLVTQKLHLGDGDDFGDEQCGWFRITFSQHREQLDEGLHRILRALHS